MQIHNIKSQSRNKKRVGRGGKRGTYSGRGIKGQRARAGAKIPSSQRRQIK
ncbi:MAG: 50S ribosomal protein L15, partial [Candidatus Omnitrophota bacterium]